MKGKLLGVLAAATLAVAGPVVTPSTAAVAQPVVAAHPCGSGYTHGVISGSHKCLRRGQFCARSADSQYRRYGFRCTKYDANVSRYRLT